VPFAKAVATLPLNDPKAAAAALRGRLRLIADDGGVVPDWSTLRIEDPTTYRDARGTEWFEWVATVQVHQSTDEAEAVADDPPASRPTVADLGILRRRPAS
jgi:hypothetical protein